jgi:hypothetical protein
MQISKISHVSSLVSANSTTERKFVSIFWMFDLQWATIRSIAFREFALSFLGNIVSINLTLMTGLTKMCCSPTEPLGNRTTKTAFKFNVICTMSRAILDSSSYTNSRTFTAHKFFRFVLLTFFLGTNTIFHSTEIGLFAFETLIIGTFEHGEL